MRHKIGYKKLGRTSSHRCAMLSNMMASILIHGSIKTTLPKAKSARPVLEKLITRAKNSSDDICLRRYLFSIFRNKELACRVMMDIVPKYINRNGGYISILKCGFRIGDSSEMAIIRLVD